MYINLQKRSVFRKKIVDGPQYLLACLKSGNFRFLKRVGRYLKGASFVVLFFLLIIDYTNHFCSTTELENCAPFTACLC